MMTRLRELFQSKYCDEFSFGRAAANGFFIGLSHHLCLYRDGHALFDECQLLSLSQK